MRTQKYVVQRRMIGIAAMKDWTDFADWDDLKLAIAQAKWIKKAKLGDYVRVVTRTIEDTVTWEGARPSRKPETPPSDDPRLAHESEEWPGA